MDKAAHTPAPDTQFFRDAFNASPIGIAVENLDGQLLFVNPAFCSFLGFSEEELRSKHCVDFSPPEDAEKDWALFQQLRAGSIDHYQLDKRYFRRDGSLVWGGLSISLLNSRSSALVLAMIEDITERKAAQEARLRLAAIVESSEDAIISRTLDGIIVSWNAGAQHIYGYTEAEAIGKPIAILLPPELPGEESRILEMLRLEGSIEHFETIRVTKTGKRINVSLTVSPIKDSSGRTVGISGIARDITERKLAEETMREMNRALEGKNTLLQAREELLGVFVKNVPAAVAMLDRDMRYLQVSDRWCSDNSVEPSKILGRLRHEAPEMPEHFKEANRRALQGETLRADEDHWESGGSTRWGRWEVRPWRGADGAVGGILILAEDITRRKEMEIKLSEMTRKLIESQEQERARIGRELHDDINQRLALLGVNLSGLKNDIPASDDSTKQRIEQLRQEITDLGNDVQSLSHRLHSSKLEYLGLAVAAGAFCKEFSHKHNISIEFQHGNIPRNISSEISLCLFRVLQEALQNAVKYSGVRKFEVALGCTSNEVHLTVRDSGVGFDPESVISGDGLGLISMRERLKLIEGQLSINSKPQYGTTIHACVPLNSKVKSVVAVGHGDH